MEGDGLTTGNPLFDKGVVKVPIYDAARPYTVLEPAWDDDVIGEKAKGQQEGPEIIPSCAIYKYGYCPPDSQGPSVFPPPPPPPMTAPNIFNVLDYGAVADDSLDNTSAFNATIAAAGPTGIIFVPAGTYRILGQIELNGGAGVSWPARLIGAGSKLSTLHISSTALGRQAAGTIQAARGACVSDLRFVYDQPDPGGDLNHVPPVLPDYSVFYHYKPAIFVNQAFVLVNAEEQGGKGVYRGGRYERLRFECCWDGITLQGYWDPGPPISYGNQPLFGQEIFDDIEMGAFNRGISIDMLTDSCYIHRFRMFPYGMTTNQQIAQQLPGHSVGIYAGRVDDARVENSFFLNGRALDAHPGLNGDGSHLTFVNCGFDSFAHINIEGGITGIDGYTSFTGCRFSNAPIIYPQDVEVSIHKQDVLFDTCFFVHTNDTLNHCVVTASDTDADKVITFNNCKFWLSDNDVAAITGTANITVNGCVFWREPTFNFLGSAIHVGAGGRATITNNQGISMTTGSGVFIHLDSDDFHNVSGNTAPGQTMLYPSGAISIQAYGNSFSTTSIGSSGQNQSLGIKNLFVEGGSTGHLKISSGSGSPASVVTADPGSLYINTVGGLWCKTSGTGNTGWTLVSGV